jgi:hypothetical protein
MPLDEYDQYHQSSYYQNINFYSNSHIEPLLEIYIEKDFVDVPEKDEWGITKDMKINSAGKAFVNTIQKLKDGLDILDYRMVTSITGRISSFQSHLNLPNKQVWNIITVHRCRNPSE